MQIEMTIKGLMVDPITNSPIVILREKEGQRVLPIWMGIFEANAIAPQIENISTPRPMDPRPAPERHSGPEGVGTEGRRLRPAGEHVLRAHLPRPRRRHCGD